MESLSLNSASSDVGELELWHDVFVHQPLPWGRFIESAVLHAGALIGVGTPAEIRQRRDDGEPDEHDEEEAGLEARARRHDASYHAVA